MDCKRITQDDIRIRHTPTVTLEMLALVGREDRPYDECKDKGDDNAANGPLEAFRGVLSTWVGLDLPMALLAVHLAVGGSILDARQKLIAFIRWANHRKLDNTNATRISAQCGFSRAMVAMKWKLIVEKVPLLSAIDGETPRREGVLDFRSFINGLRTLRFDELAIVHGKLNGFGPHAIGVAILDGLWECGILIENARHFKDVCTELLAEIQQFDFNRFAICRKAT